MLETKTYFGSHICALSNLCFAGLSPLDADFHERISRSSLGILRRDGHSDAAAYYMRNFSSLKEGIDSLDRAICEAKLCLNRSNAGKLVSEYDKCAHDYIREASFDEALRQIGAIVFMIQHVSTPKISALRMFMAGDIFERCMIKRYSPLSTKRAKCSAAKHESAADYVRQGFSSLDMVTFCFSGTAKEKRHLSTLTASLSNAEKLSAGYLRDIYFFMKSVNPFFDKEQIIMKKKHPVKEPSSDRAKDNPSKAPESGHGNEPYQTAQSVVFSKYSSTDVQSFDDPSSEPESGDLGLSPTQPL